MTKKPLISVIIPCYNEEENVPLAYQTLTKTFAPLATYNLELIYIDNCSEDKTREQIKKLVKKDHRVVGVFLSRNFGPEASGEAGIAHCTGDAMIGYPCDMQEPASMIPTFVKKWAEGYDNVIGIYSKTADNFLMFWLRKQYYKLIKAVSYVDLPLNSNGYGIMSRRVVDSLKYLPERHRILRGLRIWVGFRTFYVPYERLPRLHGKSSYSIFNYIQFTSRSFFGLSYFPLDILTYIGFFLVIGSFTASAFYVIFTLFFGNPLKTSVAILVTIVFFGGINLLATSVIGKYIQIIVEEVKNRPLYIVESVIRKKPLPGKK